MKLINRFFDESPLWQVFIIGWLIAGLILASLLYLMPNNGRLLLTGINCIKVGAMSGIPFGALTCLMVSTMRKSTIFWEYSKVVEDLVNKAETKEELQTIFENEFQDLRRKCQGGQQILKLNEIYTTMKTKSQYIK